MSRHAEAVGTRARRPARARGRAISFPFEQMNDALGKRDSRAQRAAYYLDWCAAHFPHEYQPFNTIVQQINGRTSTPRMENDEVKNLRGAMHGVRLLLQSQYKRDLDIAAGGARATVDDDDTASVVMPKKMKRLRSAKNAVLATNNLIDIAEIKSPELRAYMKRSVSDIVKLVGSEEFDRKLLLPGEGEK